MQLGLVALAMIILSSMGHSDVLKLSKARRQTRVNNRCKQCKIDNCEACFNRNFCTKCKEGLYSHSGRCYVSCPPGLHTDNETMECIGQRASECELGEWSQWSSCMKKNKTCGFKRGSQSRVRSPLPQIHSPDPSPSLVTSQTCVPEAERRQCNVTRTPCVRERKNKGTRSDDAKKRDKGNARGRGRDGSRGGGGGGGKRRKGQSRTTTAPSITTSAVT
uniref:R-spondin homolog n=1 Tax=Nothobranchius kadleci TaxID=1051664 RepID=A0A1A8D4J0_NOTKA